MNNVIWTNNSILTKWRFDLHQAKIRIEMAAERDKNRMQKDLENREEEMEEMKYHLNRKVSFLFFKPK